MTLPNHDWDPVYESRFGNDTLLESFYRPFLSEVARYDRLAGYLSFRSLATALEGVDSLLETDGRVRVIAGADLQTREKGALFPDADEPLSPWVQSQLAIVGTLLERGNLGIKVGTPRRGDGLFHPKLGIGEDLEGNRLSFEGSVNETLPAWQYNYERFKVTRSWADGEQKYVEADEETFEALWDDNHSSVDVYDLDEAAREDLIDWTDTDADIDDHVERVRSHSPESTLPESDVATVVSTAGRTPGGLHLAEDVSTITPWPHQRTVSDTAVSVYPNNLLFCDEVGLGKTIEVGLTLSRLIHTGEVDSALLLVPAGLVQQWQEELLDRFNIHAYYFDHSYDGDFLVGPFGDSDTQRIPVDGWREADTWSHTPIGEFVTDRDQPTVVVHSWHTARRSGNHSHVAPETDDAVWDLTVVDEAHNAREGTQLYDLLTEVETATDCLYALTATPMQLNVAELYDLLRLCDLPDSWDDREPFSEFFETRRALDESLDSIDQDYNTLREGRRRVLKSFRDELELDDTDEDKQKARSRIGHFATALSDQIDSCPGYDEQTATLIDKTEMAGLKQQTALEKLVGHRRISSGFDSPSSLVFECGPTEWRALVDAAEWATPVQSRIFRNTRTVLEKSKQLGLLDDTVPTRSVETKRIPLGDLKPLYDRIEDYTKEAYKESQQVLTGKEKLALGFVMTTYRQRLTSSLHAITESFRRRLDKLDEEVTDLTDEISALRGDSGVTEATVQEVLGPEGLDGYRPSRNLEIIEEEQAELESFVDDLELVTTDPKVEQLRTDIKEFRRNARDDLVIFTQYQDTLDHIREALVDTHPNIGTYSGAGATHYDREMDTWESVGKETIKQDFTSDGGTNILLCTDSASEGLNLQSADALINYDLPWNPMRVEQRIGRIDRIGQDNEVVEVLNYAYEDSVDGDIYEELEDRLSLFEDVVGPMRPVLNTVEEDIESAVMEGELTSEDVAAAAEAQAETAREEATNTGLADRSSTATTREDLIERAGIVGWGDRTHPALERIGGIERAFDPTVSTELIEILLTQSENIETDGWSFTALRNHERADEFPGTAADAYVVNHPDSHPVLESSVATETAQATLSGGNETLVTFDPTVAEEFSSIRLLLPGDPLFRQLLNSTLNSQSHNVTLLKGYLRSPGNTELVVGNDFPPDQAVMLPAALDTEFADLPDGMSIDGVDSSKAVISRWLSRHPQNDG